MDLQKQLIESDLKRQKGGWKASFASLALHGVLVGSIIFVGATATQDVDAEDKPITAFVTQGAAPPPPPPETPPHLQSAPPARRRAPCAR